MPRQKSSKTIKIVGLLMISNFLVKIFGLFREVFLAKYYGIGIYTDAYIIANNIPTVLFASLGSALATTFIPMYSNIRQEEGEKKANTFTIHLVVVVLAICFILSIIGEVFTRQIVFIFASGFTGETLEITIKFARILFPSIFGMAIMNLFGSYLQLHGKFLPFSLVPMFGNLTIILALVISNIIGNVYILVWGTLMGLLAQILFYFPWVVKSGIFTGTFKGIFRDKYLSNLLPLIIPVFMGEAVNEINSIVDRTLVSSLEIGSVSALNYAYKIINLIMGVIVGSLVTFLYPELSKLAAEKDIVKLKKRSEDSISLIFMLILPVSIVVIIFRQDIVRLLFQRGNFDETATLRTSLALGYYALGLVAMGIRDILTKIFYSLQDTKTPMGNGMVCAGLNIVLDVTLIKLTGYKGAALATALAAAISTINLLRIGNKRSIVKIKRIMSSICKCAAGGVAMSIFLWFARTVASDKYTFGIVYLCMSAIICIGGLLLYLVLQIILKNNLLKDFIGGRGHEK